MTSSKYVSPVFPPSLHYHKNLLCRNSESKHNCTYEKRPVDRMRRLKELIVGTRYERLNTQEHVTSSRDGLLFWHPHSQLEAWNPELWIPILSYIPNNLLSYSLFSFLTNYQLKLTLIDSDWEIELIVKFDHQIDCWLIILTGSQLWHWLLSPLRIWFKRWRTVDL